MNQADRGDVGVSEDASAWDVFVSYASADVNPVIGLVVALREAGLSVWWDRDRIDTFDGITSRLEEGIAGARVVLMCLSETYPSRPACQWEAVNVLSRLPQGQVAARLLPVAVTPGAGLASWPILTDLRIPDAITAPSQPADHAASHTAGQSAGGPQPERDWEPVVWKVRARLEALPTAANGLKPPIGPPPVEEVIWLPGIPATSTTFTGRFAEMLGLHSRLASDKAALDSGRAGIRPPVAVVGIGGVGKTMLVQEYVNQFSGHWPVVIKINAAGDRYGNIIRDDTTRTEWLNTLIGELQRTRGLWTESTFRPPISNPEPLPTLDTAEANAPSGAGGSGGDPLAAARRRVDIERARLRAGLVDAGAVLWWVDDIPDGFAADLTRLHSPLAAGATVFTSRSTALGQTSTELPIEPFTVTAFTTTGTRGAGPGTDAGAADSAGVALLAKHHPGAGLDGHPLPVTAADRTAMREINRLLGGLPLALDVTGARVALRKMTWPKVAQGLRENPLRLSVDSGPTASPTGHTPSVAATFAASLTDLANHSPSGTRALAACTLLGPGQALPKRLLGQVLSDTAEPLDDWDLEDILDPPLHLRLLTADDTTVRVHELIAHVAHARGHLDDDNGLVVRKRIAALATDPAWVAKSIPDLGLPLVTQVLAADDTNAPLARIVRNQAHNLAQAAAAADAAFHMAWEALRSGNLGLHEVWCQIIRDANGVRVVPKWTNDQTNPALVRILIGHSERVSELAFDVVDGRNVLASKSHPNGTVRLWDPGTGEMLPSDGMTPIRWVSIGYPTRPYDRPRSFVVRGRFLRWSCPHRRCVVVEDATTAAELWRLEPGPHISLLGTFEFEGHLVLAMGYGDSLWLLNPLSGATLTRLGGHQPATRQMDIHPGQRVVSAASGVVDGRALLATGGSDGVVRIWAPTLRMTADQDAHLEAVASGSRVATRRGFSAESTAAVAVLTASERDLLAYIETDGSVRIWDPESEQRIETQINAPATSVLAARQLGGRTVLATGHLHLWDIASGESIREITGYCDYVASLDVGTIDQRPVLVYGGNDFTHYPVSSGPPDQVVRIHDIHSGDVIHEFDGSVAALAGEAVGRAVATGSYRNGLVRIWDPVSGKLRRTLTEESPGTSSLCFGQVGNRVVIAQGRRNGAIALWDTETGELLHTLVGHTGEVGVVQFGHLMDRTLLVSGGWDRKLVAWDPVSGMAMCTIGGFEGSVSSIAVLDVGDVTVIATAAGQHVQAFTLLD